MKKDILIEKINKSGKTWFSLKELRRMFAGESYIKTSIKRLKDSGVLAPVCRGVYQLKNSTNDIEKVATQIYFPSYVSFESALSKYGVINQGLYGLTLATTRHSKKIKLSGISCEYCQLKKDLFFGFELKGGVYVAVPEKAFLDQLYLMSLGKRSGEVAEWNLDGLRKSVIKKMVKAYGKKVKTEAEKLMMV